LHESGGVGGEAVGGDGDALIIAIEQVEGIDTQVESIAVSDVDFAGDAEIGSSVVGSGEAVAAVAGKPVVEIVAVLVGIASDAGVHWAPAAVVDDAGELPVVEDVAEKLVFTVKWARLGGKSDDQAIALIGDAGSAFSRGVVGILHGRGRACDQRILAVVDGMGVSVGESKIGSARNPAIDGERSAVVDARCGALKNIDGA